MSGLFRLERRMTSEQFCYWLQGFAELSGDNPPTPEQWKSIREHVATVFTKVTPPVQCVPNLAKPSPTIDPVKDYLEAMRRAEEKQKPPFGQQPDRVYC
jgi:hypothetical protein